MVHASWAHTKLCLSNVKLKCSKIFTWEPTKFVINLCSSQNGLWIAARSESVWMQTCSPFLVLNTQQDGDIPGFGKWKFCPPGARSKHSKQKSCAKCQVWRRGFCCRWWNVAMVGDNLVFWFWSKKEAFCHTGLGILQDMCALFFSDFPSVICGFFLKLFFRSLWLNLALRVLVRHFPTLSDLQSAVWNLVSACLCVDLMLQKTDAVTVSLAELDWEHEMLSLTAMSLCKGAQRTDGVLLPLDLSPSFVTLLLGQRRRQALNKTVRDFSKRFQTCLCCRCGSIELLCAWKALLRIVFSVSFLSLERDSKQNVKLLGFDSVFFGSLVRNEPFIPQRQFREWEGTLMIWNTHNFSLYHVCRELFRVQNRNHLICCK